MKNQTNKRDMPLNWLEIDWKTCWRLMGQCQKMKNRPLGVKKLAGKSVVSGWNQAEIGELNRGGSHRTEEEVTGAW